MKGQRMTEQESRSRPVGSSVQTGPSGGVDSPFSGVQPLGGGTGVTGAYVDLFAGPGGWDEGIKPLGIRPIGVEWDEHACETARAAGHVREQADIAKLYPGDFGFIDGLIASPPCQGFSMAGSGKGRKDSAKVIRAVGEFIAGRDPRDDLAAEMEDSRSVLALEPLRWALTLRPEWMTWEQVPAVLPLWEACAEALRADGYSVWTGNVQAEQYGVPQTRKRSILIASRNREVARPEPTHSKFYPRDKGKVDVGLPRWVSMADALGWGMTQRPSMTVTGGGTGAGGAEPFGNAARQGMHRELEAGRWEMAARRDSPAWIESDGPRSNRTADLPAVTITGEAHRWTWTPTTAVAGDSTWVYERPSPTIVGSYHPEIVAAPGYRKAGDPPRQRTPGSVRITVEEAACLQSFPVGYPWQGKQGVQFRQVGDAVPPLLAQHVVAEAIGVQLASEVAA